MKRGRATVYFYGEASNRLGPFSHLLVLRCLEIRSNRLCARRQGLIQSTCDRDRLDLIQLCDQVVERCGLERALPLFQFERLLAVSQLEIDRAAINPELLAGNPFAFSERTNLRDLLLDVGPSIYSGAEGPACSKSASEPRPEKSMILLP